MNHKFGANGLTDNDSRSPSASDNALRILVTTYVTGGVASSAPGPSLRKPRLYDYDTCLLLFAFEEKVLVPGEVTSEPLA